MFLYYIVDNWWSKFVDYIFGSDIEINLISTSTTTDTAEDMVAGASDNIFTTAASSFTELDDKNQGKNKGDAVILVFNHRPYSIHLHDHAFIDTFTITTITTATAYIYIYSNITCLMFL